MSFPRKFWFGVQILLFATLPALSAAQESEPTESEETESESSANTSMMRLDKISVTATRNPIKAIEYPGMVTVIGQEAIKLQQPSTPDDILKFVPNVEFTGGPRRTGETPSIRGFDGPDVILIFDGARQNFGSAHDGRFFIDPTLLKEVEVLRGPASSLYGSGGTGGVIEFRTIDAADLLGPGETFGFSTGGGYQFVNEEYHGTFSAFGRPIDGVDLVGSVTRRDSGTIDLGDGNKLRNSDDDIIAGFAKGGFELGDFHRIETSFITFNNDAREPNNGQGLGGDDSVDKEIRSNTVQVGYRYTNPDNNLLDVDAVVYYTDFKTDELLLDNLGPVPIGEVLKRDVNTFGFRADNRSRIDISDSFFATFTYGGEFYDDTQDGAAGSGERDGVPDADATFYGLFAQAELSINDAFGFVPGEFIVIPGIRYDDFETTSSVAGSNSDSEISPRIGVSYLPTEWLIGFVNYAHAFRAPTFDELYLTGVHFTIPIGPGIINRFVSNPNLTPQRTRTLEYGGGFNFDDVFEPGDVIQLKASRFEIWGEDFIDLSVNQPTPFVDCNPFIPGNCDGTTVSANVPRAELIGRELEAVYEGSRFLASFGFSSIDGENEDTGAKLGLLAPDQFTLNTAVKFPEIDSILGWRAIFAREFDKVNDPDDRRDSYRVFDVYFAWQPIEGVLSGLRIDLGVDNIFDENYTRVFTGAAEAGRNFKATIGYTIRW